MHNVNYFNVVLLGDKNYEVVETPHKNKIFRKKSALTNLKNIEKVLDHNLVLKGENSTSSHENKLTALRIISQYITDNYTSKVSKLNWLSRKLFSKEKQVQALNKKIRETINHLATPPSFDKVPAEITTLIANFLDENALKKLTQASKAINDQVGYNFICEAKRYGFEGNDVEGAKNFLKAFEKQVDFALIEIMTTDPKLMKQVGQTLEMSVQEKVVYLKKQPTEKIVNLLTKKYFYQQEDLHIFEKFFHTLEFPIITNPEENVREKLNVGLKFCIESSVKSFSKFLLKNGASANYTNDNDQRLFVELIKKGNVELVKEFIEHGATVDALETERTFSPLSLACGVGAPLLPESASEMIVRLLLDNGANSNQLIGGTTPLLAICFSQIKLNPIAIQILLDHGTNTDVTDQVTGVHAIHYLSQKGNFELFKVFIEKLFIQNPNFDINLRSPREYTALAYACGVGFPPGYSLNLSLVEFLLEKGANPNIVIQNQALIDSAASVANKYDQLNLLKLLVDNPYSKVGNVTSSLKYLWPNLRSDQDVSVNPELLQFLLENGADPNVIVTEDKTPLHFAAQAGNEKAVELLLKYGANVNVGEEGKTPLLFALGFGGADYYKPSVKIVELLLTAGAKWDCYKFKSYSEYAFLYASEEIIDFILQQKQLNYPNGSAKKNILHQLAKKQVLPADVDQFNRHFQRFIFLLTRGADLNSYDLSGYLPIHNAIETGNLTFLMRLIEYGVSPLTLTQDGLSAKMLVNARLANMPSREKLRWKERLIPLLGDFNEDPYANGAALPPQVDGNGNWKVWRELGRLNQDNFDV